MINRDVVGDEAAWFTAGVSATCPFADLVHGGIDVARRSNDHALEPVRILARRIGQVPVKGADDADLQTSDPRGPTRLVHAVGIRKCPSVPSSSMSRTRLSA